MTAAPLQTVFDLAKEAIEKREHADEECDRLWTDYHQAGELVNGKTSLQKLQEYRPAPRGLGKVFFLEDAERLVKAMPTREHRVACLPSHNAAYKHRVKWINRGFRARTEMESPGEYAVYAQAE